jgi:hypothetical protein
MSDTNETPATAGVMSRQRAALLHFLISVAVFAAVITPLLMLWYPPPLFFADGGWDVIQLAAGVDIVIGPLLTLMVFKSGKKGLRFDLTVIALLQLAALAWGVHIMYRERPLFLAFAEDRFSTVTFGQIAAEQRALEELLKLGSDTPVRVLVRLPDDPQEAIAIKLAQFRKGTSVFRLTERYQALDAKNLDYVYRNAVNMELFMKRRPQYRERYDAFLRGQKLGAEQLAFVPLVCRYANLIIVLSRADGSIVGSIDIPPPEYRLF